MTTAIDNRIQHWIDTSGHVFAESLRSQQRRGKVLSERQLAVAARIVGEPPKTAETLPANNTFLGQIGQTLTVKVVECHEHVSRASNAYTKLITEAGHELVFFGRLSRVGTGWLSLTVREHSEWNGKRSTVISQPDWVASVTDVELVDLSQATALLDAFRAAPPVIQPESKTPFADFARQLRK